MMIHRFRRLRSVLRDVWRSSRLDAEMREEFRHHIDMRTEDLLREGHSPAEARRRARIEFGFLLLVGAGLMLRSFRAALEVDPGFDPEGVLTAQAALTGITYPDGDARRRFYDEWLREVRTIPGVVAAVHRAGALLLAAPALDAPTGHL